MFGESVMYKDITSLKGEPVYKKGVWVGKSAWSDSHIVLSGSGAIETRSIRRLPHQFSAMDMVMVRDLPWNYSTQGILMEMKGAPTRTADPEEVDEQVDERKAQQAGTAVAFGLLAPGLPTHVPGAVSQSAALPSTPAGHVNPGGESSGSGIVRPSSPREEACKRDDVIEDDGSPSKRIRVEPAEVEMTEPAGGVKRQLGGRD